MSRAPTLKSHPHLTAEFVRLFQEGQTVVQACVMLDVPRTSFQEWRRWGSIEPLTGPDGKPRTPKEPYAAFARAVNQTLATYEIALMSEVTRQGHDARDKKGNVLLDLNGQAVRLGDWRALEFILRTRFPKRYAPQIRVLYEEQLNAALAALERGLPPEVFALVLDILSSADQGDADVLGAGAPPTRAASAGGSATH